MGKEATEKLSVVQTFGQLPDEKKIVFTQKTLEALRKTVSNPKTKVAFLQKFLTVLLAPEKTSINPEDLKILQQTLVSFLFSLKPEFMYDWAEIIDFTIGYPPPKDAEQRKQYVKSRKWFHVDLDPELWKKVNQKMNELGSVESFFTEAITTLNRKSRKR